MRINLAKENFNIFVEIGKIQNYITKSTKKLTEKLTREALIDEISSRILRSEFFKKKCLKCIFKHILPTI